MENKKNRKMLLGILFWCVAIILATNVGRTTYRAARPVGVRADSVHAYTVIRTEKGYDKAGTLKFTIQYVEAVKMDGSRMWEVTTPIEHRRDIFAANGDEILANELIGKKSTYPKRYLSVPAHETPEASCQSESDVKGGWVVDGTDNIGGFRAVRRVYKTAQRVMTEWNALDASCAVVQGRFDNQDGVTEQTLQSLVLAEPDPALFKVPDRFDEVPPSGLYVPVCAADGKCTSVPDFRKRQLDKNYYDLRASLH